MKQVFIILVLCFMTSFAYGADKGWSVAVDTTTNEIKGWTYGNYTGKSWTDAGYVIVKVASRNFDRSAEPEDYVYKNSKVVKRPQSEIDAIETAKKDKEKKRRTIDLTIKKKEAQSLGYTDLEQEYQDQIDNLSIGILTP